MLQATQAALAAEGPRVERLQAQLKELIVFPHDLQPLPDGVVAAIQEYQRYPGGSGAPFPRLTPSPGRLALSRNPVT